MEAQNAVKHTAATGVLCEQRHQNRKHHCYLEIWNNIYKLMYSMQYYMCILSGLTSCVISSDKAPGLGLLILDLMTRGECTVLERGA